MTDQYRLVLCNTPADLSETLAKTLVEERLAACVNIVKGVKSVYRWEGEICIDTENTLLIKTTAARLTQLTKRINELHSYDLPEVIAIEIQSQEGEKRYLDWLSGEVKINN
ncbi:MAG: divalent-cation tolerance protein CutA [Planctomycetota bacterium]|nr:divalent-cation tolerance protein CutA [Planctomycetota bacterium]